MQAQKCIFWTLGCSKKLKVSLIFLPMQGAMCGYYTEPIKKKYWVYLQYWRYARAFCKYKGNPKIYKGKFIPIFILKNIGQLGCCGWSFARKWIPEVQTSWKTPISDKLHAPTNCTPNCMRMQFGKKLHAHAIYNVCNHIKMGVYQLVWTLVMHVLTN